MRAVVVSLVAASVLAASVTDAGTPTPVTGEDLTVVGEAILAAPAAAVASAPTLAVTTNTDCTDTAFALEKWHLTGTYTWSYNPANAPVVVRSSSAVTIYRATSNLIYGYGRCSHVVLPLSHSYKGSAVRVAQVSSIATCTGNDGVSVTSWGVLPSYTLAYTCAYYKTSTGVLVSSDMLLNSAKKWFTDTVPAGCVDSFDLESVVAHERGHTVGLAHVDQTLHPRQTMSPRTLACTTYKRRLGSGDLLGLKTLTGTS
jgi:Matrixin